MAEQNQIRTLMDRILAALQKGSAKDALKDLSTLDGMGSDDPRTKLYMALAANMEGRKEDARHLATFARMSAQNIVTEADALLTRLK